MSHPTLGPVSPLKARLGPCGDCAYYTLDPYDKTNLNVHVCRRHPPGVSFFLMPITDKLGRQGMGVQRQSGHPIVLETGGCGEFKSRVTP